MSLENQSIPSTLGGMQQQHVQAKQALDALQEQETRLRRHISDLRDAIARAEFDGAWAQSGDEGVLRRVVTTAGTEEAVGSSNAMPGWLKQSHPGLGWREFRRRGSLTFSFGVHGSADWDDLGLVANSITALGRTVLRLMRDHKFVAGMSVHIYSPTERMILAPRTPILMLELTDQGWDLRTFVDVARSSATGGLLGTSGADCRALLEQARAVAFQGLTPAQP